MGFFEWLGRKINEGVAWFERKTGIDIPFVGTTLSKKNVEPASYSTTVSKQQAKEIEQREKRVRELLKEISSGRRTAPSPKPDLRKIREGIEGWKEVKDPAEAIRVAVEFAKRNASSGYVPEISRIEKRERTFRSSKTYYIDESGVYEGNKLVQKFEKPEPKRMEIPYIIDYARKTVYFPVSARSYVDASVLPESAVKRGWKIEFKDMPQYSSSGRKLALTVEQRIDLDKLAKHYRSRGYKVSFENGKLKVEVPVEHKYVEYRVTPYPFKSYYEYEEALRKERKIQNIVEETMKSPDIRAKVTRILGPRFTPVDPFGLRTLATFVGGVVQRKPMEKIAEDVERISREGVEYAARLYTQTKNPALFVGRFTLESPVAQLGFAVLGGEGLGALAARVPSVGRVVLNPTFQRISVAGFAGLEAGKLYSMKASGFSNEQIIAEAGKDVVHAIGFGAGFKHAFEKLQPKIFRVKLFSGVEEQRLRIVSESPEVNKILSERLVAGYRQVEEPKFLRDVMHVSEIERLKASYRIKLGTLRLGGKKLYFADVHVQKPIISEVTTTQKPEIQEWVELRGIRVAGRLFGQDILTGNRIGLDVWKSLMVPVGGEKSFKPLVVRGKPGRMKPLYFPKEEKPSIPKVDNSLIYERAEHALLGEKLDLVMKGEIPLKYSTSSQKLLPPEHRTGFVRLEPTAVPVSLAEVKPVVLRFSTSTSSTALITPLQHALSLRTVGVIGEELKLKMRSLISSKPSLAFRLEEFLLPKTNLSLGLDLKSEISPKQTITTTLKTVSKLDLSLFFFLEGRLTSQKIGIKATRFSAFTSERLFTPRIPKVGLGKVSGSAFEKYFLGYGRGSKRKRKVGIRTMSDLFSIEESFIKFGKATIPSGKIAKMKFLNVNIFGRFPTFELIKKSRKKHY